MSMEDKIKLIFFDMEGTLFRKSVKDPGGKNIAPSAWTLISQKLGKKAEKEEDATKQKWDNEEYAGYVEWMEDTIRVHQKYGLTKDLFYSIMNSSEYFPGVKETFEELKKRKVMTALISGGFKAQADRAVVDLGIKHAFAACEYFFDSEGKLVAWNLLPCDYDGKVDFMHLIIKEHGLSKKQCGFVGDSVNDIALAKEVGVSIAFNGNQRLQDITTHAVNQPTGQEDFRAILKYF